MTPDPGSLRSCAQVLDARATELESARTDVQTAMGATTWVAAAADRQRAHLAGVDARARTGVDELRAAAGHLRRLATAIETLEGRMLRAWTTRRASLQEQLAAVSSDPARAAQAADLRHQLATLPFWTDVSWADRVERPAVPVPSVPVSRSNAPFGPYAPVAVVRIDVSQVRGLATVLENRAQVVAAGRSATFTSSALPFGRLDAYGLPGSATGAFLTDATSSAGDHAAAATGWVTGASRARALATLVEQADSPAALRSLLNDPRSETALDLAELLAATPGDEEVGVLLLGLSDPDAEWMLEHVPGLEQRLSQSFPTWELVDMLNGVATAPGVYGLEQLRRGDDLGREAKSIKGLRSTGTPAERALARARHSALLRQMRAARADGNRYTGLTRSIPGGSTALRVLTAAPDVPVLRHVPYVSILLTGVGIYDDTTREHDPLSVEHAVIKNVGSTTAGLVTTTVVTGLLAGTAVVGSVALAPIVLGVIAGAAVGYGVGQVIENYDEIADWTGDRLSDAGDALSDVGGGIKDGVSGAWNSVFG